MSRGKQPSFGGPHPSMAEDAPRRRALFQVRPVSKGTQSRTLLSAAFLVLVFSWRSGSAATQAPQTLSGVVTHVVDGDTLDVTVAQRVVTVRLDGIDAPERGQPFSAQARALLRVLAFSQRATVHVKDTDRYGRLVARVVVGGKDLSEEMVVAGLAWHYLQYSSDARLAALEKRAREKRLGVWANPSAVPPWVFRHPGTTPTPTKPGVQSRGPAVSGPFHGNVWSHVYHAPGCRDYDCPNCWQVFASREQAEAAGYTPHAACVLGRR